MNKYLIQNNKPETVTWISTVLKNYLKKNEEHQLEIEHILDYMNSDSAPSRLKKMSYSQAKSNAEKWNKALQKKGKHIEEVEGTDYKVVKKFKGYKLIKLLGENAFKREGFLMSHCVGSYFNKDLSEIYSLRDEDNMPHCTIEVTKQGNSINQIKGKGNGSIHPKYIKNVLSILKYFKMEVRENEMQNLGYFVFNEEELAWLKKNFKINAIKLDKKEYVFFHDKLKEL